MYLSNPMVSVIVPVYNAESTLRRCADSILEQSYPDLELILVDDGSKDASPLICDSYMQKDARVRVIHKPNSGASATRNLGIAEARGHYLQFVDSDDWLTPDATEKLVAAAEAHQADLVIADFYRVSGKLVASKHRVMPVGVMTRREYASKMMENPASFYYGVLWNKLYRRDLVVQHHLEMNPAHLRGFHVQFGVPACRPEHCRCAVAGILLRPHEELHCFPDVRHDDAENPLGGV